MEIEYLWGNWDAEPWKDVFIPVFSKYKAQLLQKDYKALA